MYRISRNIEASLIDKITEWLSDDGWVGIQVTKSFAEIYKNPLPAICVNALEIRPEKLEIGSKTNIKYFTVTIKIFATSDGQRLDLSDWLFDKLEDDVNYYSYVITNGEVAQKDLSGRIVLIRWFENRKELVNSENLAKEDKFRHLLQFEAIVALS
jgi:hypothetical protein